jgi:hypothetical protein
MRGGGATAPPHTQKYDMTDHDYILFCIAYWVRLGFNPETAKDRVDAAIREKNIDPALFWARFAEDPRQQNPFTANATAQSGSIEHGT